MPITEYSQQDLDEARRALWDETPIYMVNLIRYRTEADCGGGLRFVPCAGRDAYQQRYVAVAAFNKTMEDETVSVVWLGGVAGVVVAPDGKSLGGHRNRAVRRFCRAEPDLRKPVL